MSNASGQKRDTTTSTTSATITTRPWGTYEVIRAPRADNFLVKRICVHPGHRLSLQSHAFRSEHWVVVQGEGEVTVGEDLVKCALNTHIFIPRGTKHRISNINADTLIFVEVQVGDRLEEGDIVRYEDDYNRTIATRTRE